MLVYIGDIYTIKNTLRKAFVEETNSDVVVKLANVIELIDLLEYHELGYKIEYKDQIRIIKARKLISENKIVF